MSIYTRACSGPLLGRSSRTAVRAALRRRAAALSSAATATATATSTPGFEESLLQGRAEWQQPARFLGTEGLSLRTGPMEVS